MESGRYYTSRAVWFHAVHASLGFLFFSYCLSAFNTTALNIGSTLGWSEDSIYIPIANALFTIGATLSSGAAFYISKSKGKRQTLIYCDLLLAIGSIVTIVPFTETFLLGRLVTGLASGGYIPISPVYINEITPDEMVAKVGTFVQIAANAALIMTASLGLLLPTENYENNVFNYFWMFIFGFPAIFAIYRLYYFKYFAVFDTPLWYLTKNDKESAVKSLMCVYTTEGIQIGLSRLEDKRNSNTEDKLIESEITFKDVLCSKKYRKMLRISICLLLLQQFSGINLIVMYSTSIFTDIGGSTLSGRCLTLAAMAINLMSSLVSIPLLSIYGRKTLIIAGQYGIIIDLFLLSLFSSILDFGVIPPALCIFVFFLLFSFSLGSSLWALLGEISNEIALSIGVFCTLLSLVIISFTFPLIVESVGISGTFLFFVAILTVGVVYDHIDLFETKGKTQQDIQRLIFPESAN